MLRRHSLKATENVRGAGEMDVTFAVEGQRFVVEAKWQSEAVESGAIFKLQRRVRQRLGGTIGLMLSMSGFTPDALRDVKDGERLEVLLLDRSHFEAMLSSFAPPVELLQAMMDCASYKGDFYTPLVRLLEDDSPFPGKASITTDLDELAGWQGDWFAEFDQFYVSRAVTGFPFGQSGLSVTRSGSILVTVASGAYQLDLKSGEVKPWHRIGDCHGCIVDRSEGLYITRRQGVARLDVNGLHPLFGGIEAAVALVPTGGQPSVLVGASWPMSMSGGAGPARLVEVPRSLGESSRSIDLDYPPQCSMNAATLSDGRRVVVGSCGIRVLSDDVTRTVGFNGANPMGLTGKSTTKLYCVADTRLVSLFEIDADGLVAQELGQFNLAGSISHLVSHGGRLYLMSHTRVYGPAQPEPVILELSRRK